MKIAVTGAFGYSGQEIAKVLLERGHELITLTNRRPENDPFAGKVAAFPLQFADRAALANSLGGVDVLINTYWVRFNHKNFNHEDAVKNSGILFETAKMAGIKRIVHTSIANPSENSPFEYYRGKARIEKKLFESDIPHTILRPTVIFGANDILLNNIAWTLRSFPVMGIFGDGCYRIRPIHVNDFAELAADSVEESGNLTINAVGPEDYQYRELVAKIAEIIGIKRTLIRIPKSFGYLVASAVGFYQKDRFLTWEEIGALMAGLLSTDGPGRGKIKLSEWCRENAATQGKKYASELARR